MKLLLKCLNLWIFFRIECMTIFKFNISQTDKSSPFRIVFRIQWYLSLHSNLTYHSLRSTPPPNIQQSDTHLPTFFFVFLAFFENCWKMFTFYLYNAPRISTLPSETTPNVWNEALFRLVMLYIDTKTKKQKKTHHCKINTFITPFRI